MPGTKEVLLPWLSISSLSSSFMMCYKDQITRWVWAVELKLRPSGIWGWIILCCGGCPVLFMVFSSIPCLSPRDTSSTLIPFPFASCDNKKSKSIANVTWAGGEGLSPVETHWCKGWLVRFLLLGPRWCTPVSHSGWNSHCGMEHGTQRMELPI